MPRTKKARPAQAEKPCEGVQGGCEINELFRVLGKTHMLDILHLFIHSPHPLRFVEVQDRLRLSPNTLSQRLNELREVGLVSRTAYNEIPPRVDYEATRKALNLKPVFASLQDWAISNDLSPAAPEKAAATA